MNCEEADRCAFNFRIICVRIKLYLYLFDGYSTIRRRWSRSTDMTQLFLPFFVALQKRQNCIKLCVHTLTSIFFLPVFDEFLINRFVRRVRVFSSSSFLFFNLNIITTVSLRCASFFFMNDFYFEYFSSVRKQPDTAAAAAGESEREMNVLMHQFVQTS